MMLKKVTILLPLILLFISTGSSGFLIYRNTNGFEPLSGHHDQEYESPKRSTSATEPSDVGQSDSEGKT